MSNNQILENDNQEENINILDEVQNQSKDNMEEEAFDIERGLTDESIYHKSIKVIVLGDSSKYKCNASRDKKEYCIKSVIVYCKISGDTCYTVSRCAYLGNGTEDCAAGTTDHTTYERLHKSEVYTEDCRLCDTESC